MGAVGPVGPGAPTHIPTVTGPRFLTNHDGAVHVKRPAVTRVLGDLSPRQVDCQSKEGSGRKEGKGEDAGGRFDAPRAKGENQGESSHTCLNSQDKEIQEDPPTLPRKARAKEKANDSKKELERKKKAENQAVCPFFSLPSCPSNQAIDTGVHTHDGRSLPTQHARVGGGAHVHTGGSGDVGFRSWFSDPIAHLFLGNASDASLCPSGVIVHA